MKKLSLLFLLMAVALVNSAQGVAQTAGTDASTNAWADWSILAKMVVVLTGLTVVSWLGYLVTILLWRDEPQGRRKSTAPHDSVSPSPGYQHLSLANHLLAIRQEREKARYQREDATSSAQR